MRFCRLNDSQFLVMGGRLEFLLWSIRERSNTCEGLASSGGGVELRRRKGDKKQKGKMKEVRKGSKVNSQCFHGDLLFSKIQSLVMSFALSAVGGILSPVGPC